jgi:hypothetical protein
MPGVGAPLEAALVDVEERLCHLRVAGLLSIVIDAASE